MSTYCPAQDGSITFIGPATNAFSDAAERVERVIQEGLRHYAEPRMEALISEIDQIMAETALKAGEGFAPVDPEAASAALRLAYLLPRFLPTPEVASDPDGDISFDWLGRSGKMFSISVSKTGRIAYAGRFGDKSKFHGTDQLSASCPPEIILGIKRAIA
jgi:hypothetical protein